MLLTDFIVSHKKAINYTLAVDFIQDSQFVRIADWLSFWPKFVTLNGIKLIVDQLMFLIKIVKLWLEGMRNCWNSVISNKTWEMLSDVI